MKEGANLPDFFFLVVLQLAPQQQTYMQLPGSFIDSFLLYGLSVGVDLFTLDPYLPETFSCNRAGLYHSLTLDITFLVTVHIMQL